MTVIPSSRSLRAFVACASVMAVLFLAAGSASAQTYSGRFPRNDSPNTWRRPNGACNGTSPEPATERTFNTLWVSLPASGTWTVTATRQGGGPIAMDFYQPSFLPNGPCVNRWDATGVEGTNSVSRTFTNCAACTGSTYFFEVVISGANAVDVGNFTLTVSGPAKLVSQCGTNGGMSPSVQSAPNSGGSFSANFFPPGGLGCPQAWTATGIPAWITGFTTSGTGPRTFTYTVANNTGGARTANITVGTGTYSQTLQVRQAAASCSYSLAVTTANPSAAAGNGSSTMTANAGCAWAGNSTATWLSANSGSGNGNLVYTYDANPGPARSAVINAGGQSLTVNQASGCSATVPSSTSVGSGAGGWGVDFTMTSGACPWTASTSDSWITVLDPSGFGDGTVDFNFSANIGPARSGTITIAGRTHTVNQAAGCVSSLPSTSITVVPTAGMASAAVTMSANACPWTATSTTSWITVGTNSGMGTGTVNFSFGANVGPARVGTITIAGRTFQVTQSNGCTFSLASNMAGAGSGGSTSSVGLTASSPACSWNATANAPWISGVPVNGMGSGNVSYTLAPNPGVGRTGTITIAGQTFSITQGNGCSLSLPSSSGPVGAGAGTHTAAVTMSDGTCPRSAATSTPWISILTPSGTGSGDAFYGVTANLGPARSGTITFNNTASYTVNQAAGCTTSLPTATGTIGAAGGTGTAAINLTAGACPWTATTPASWLSITTPSGMGSGNVGFTADPNTGPQRTAVITMGGQSFTLTQASGCTAMLASSMTSASAAGGSGGVGLTMSNAACTWTASTATPWISGVPTNGTGSSTVNYTLAANPGVSRTGTITIAGQTFTITQGNGCSSSLPSSSRTVGPSAVNSTAAIAMSDATCPWNASSNTAWISILTPAGTGSGDALYSVSANPGPARSGTITVDGHTYTVNQASGCSASIAPASAMPGSAGGAASFGITMTDAACPWTASSGDGWITGVTTGGTGNGTVSYSVAANLGPARVGTITAGGQTFTVTQANGCTAALVSNSASPSAAGGSASAGLTMSDAACPWTASTSTPWISGVPMSGTGSTGVSYTVAPNPGLARSGTITIAGQTFTVNQGNGCTVTLPATRASLASGTATTTASITLSDAACPWTASSSTPWISAVTPSGTGSGAVSYTVAANPGLARTGTITLGGQTFTVNQGNGCTAMLGATSAAPGAAGGAATVGITMSDVACPWTTATATPWISMVTPNGVGTSSVVYSVDANTGPARSGSITIGGLPFAVNQASGCMVTVTPMSTSVSASSGTTSFAVNTVAGCGWSAASLQPWVTSVTPGGTGPGTVTVGYAGNPGLVRTGTVTVLSTTTTSEAEFSFTQANGCVAMVSPLAALMGASGGTGSVDVTMSDAACPFTVSSDQGWVTPLITSGAGTTTFGYSVAANVGPQRNATLTVAGQAVGITQTSGCSITLLPSDASVDAAADSTAFNVVTAAGCGFTTSESIAWVTNVTASGTGPGPVTLDYAANVSVPRSGVITVTSTDTGVSADFTLDQGDGCTASLGNTTESVGAGASTESVELTLSDAACPFTVSAGATWLTPDVASGNGTTTVAYDVAANTGPERTATITIATETLTVTQASGCTIDIAPASASVSQAAGTTSFDVTTDAGCVYDVTHTTPWLASVPLSGTGPGTFTFGYQANTGIERSGSVTVTTDTGDAETFSLTQGDGCIVTLATSAADVAESGGTSDFVVTMGTGCTYDASSNAAWLTASVSATGVTYTVPAWDGAARSAEIMVTSDTSASIETFVVTQQSGCVVMLTPGSATVSGAGEQVTFTVVSGEGCTFAATSEDEFISGITIAGDTVTFRVGENGRMTRMGTVLVTSDTTDSEGTFVIQQGEGDGRPGDGGVAIGVVPVGDGCSTAPGTRGGSGAFVGVLLLLGLALRRRARAGVVVVGAALLVLPTLPTGASAQAFEEGYDLEALRPASSARVDYVSVESGESRLAGWFELGATLGYDALPLVVRASNGEDTRAVAGQGWLRLGGAFAIGQRFRLGVQMPFVLARHGDMAVLPDYPDADRPAFGDLALVPKLTLLTREPDAGAAFGQGFSLAVLVPLTLPTGQAGRLAGEDATVEPRVALDYATARGFGGALNVGFRIREARDVLGNQLDEAVTLGLAGRVPLVSDRLFAVAEVVTDIAVRTPTTRNASRGEVLASLRYANQNIVASGGVGAGFLGGLATPRFRVYASLTYAPTHGRSEPEPEPEPQPDAVDPEPRTEPEAEPQVAVAEPVEPEPQVAEPVRHPDPEPQVADAQPELDRCEANPTAAGCGVQTLCGTADMHALRDEAGLVTVSGFAVDSAELPAGSDADVARIAERLLANPDLEQVIVVGHADPSGSRAHNAALTRRRAQRVRDALVQAGVPRRRLILRAVGSVCSQPPDDQASNRRVEFLVVQ